MGTPDFAVPSLETLVRHGFDLCAVLTAPDKPRGRGQEVLPSPVKRSAGRHRLPLLQPASLRDPDLAAELTALAPDIIVVVAFRILPVQLIVPARLGAINLHASLLPKYRGAAPINWALINGEEATGVTTFFLEEKVDAGAIIYQQSVPIENDDDAGSLHDKLADAGAALVLKTVRSIVDGTAPRLGQDDTAATPAPKIFREDCNIHWDKPARSIRNFIRGLSPSPAATTIHGGKNLKVFRSDIEYSWTHLAPGEVQVEKEKLLVGTADAALSITELQQEGRKRMGSREFLRGYRITTGDRLT